MRVLVVNGSSTAPSSNDVIADVFMYQMRAKGLHPKVLNIYEQSIPILVTADNESLMRIRELVQSSDVLVLITPLYHGSFSGAMKLFLDQLSRDAFSGKQVVLVANSSNSRNAQVAAQELIPVVWTMQGTVQKLVGICSDDYSVTKDGTRTLANLEILDRISLIADQISSNKPSKQIAKPL